MAIEASELVVQQGEISEADVRAIELAPPGDGGVLLAVERFALTTNNVTYAVAGDGLQYWRFFPTDVEGGGIVPAWGAASVVASDDERIEVGERWYGFVPMATHLAVQPGEVSAHEVADRSAHREGLAEVYQRYTRLHADPLHSEATLDLELLYRPLFTTAFLLAEVVAGDAGGGHDVVVITSASSKTGTALAHLLADRDVAVVGVTSAGNVEHVTATGLHDRVLAYGELDGLADLTGPAVLVDLAGRADVVAAANSALDDLVAHLVVGVTHHDADGSPRSADPSAPEPTMFFAPTHAAELADRWGASELHRRVAAAWRPFVADVASQLDVVEVEGLAGAADQWRRLVAGDVDPGVGLVVALG